MKIVINNCYGGFGLSYKATMRYAELKSFKLYAFKTDGACFDKYVPYNKGDEASIIYYSTKPLNFKEELDEDGFFSDRDIERTDPILIQIVEEIKKDANDMYAELKIVEIPPAVRDNFKIGEEVTIIKNTSKRRIEP